MMRSTLRWLMGWPCLAQFLGDDFRGSLRIQEAMADDQTHDLLGAAVIGFGAARLQSQTREPLAAQRPPATGNNAGG